MNNTPPGLTHTRFMPYGYRRWNGAVWADEQVDAYNRELSNIVTKHRAGYDTEHLVNGLYNLAASFDTHGKEEVR